jgi:hypothetical protein
VVLVAQLIGLVAAAAFGVHAAALAHGLPPGRSTTVRIAGIVVAASAALTAVPVLVLVAIVDRDSDRFIAAVAKASDWTDVVLFAAMSIFAAAVTRASNRLGVRAVAVAVALVAAGRAVLLANGSSVLDIGAPVAFLVLVTVVSVRDLAHTKPL